MNPVRTCAHNDVLLAKGIGYRLRVGSFRVLFVIDDRTRTVTVTGFGPRKDVYR